MNYQYLKSNEERNAWIDGRQSYLSGITETNLQGRLAEIWHAGYDTQARCDYMDETMRMKGEMQ